MLSTLACGTWEIVTHIALIVSTFALTISIAVSTWVWARTIRSMRAARDDMLIARSTYETAVRSLGRERRQHT